MDKKTMMIAGGALAFFVIIMIVIFFRKKSGGGGSPSTGPSGSDSEPTIYGSLGCPYTVKQMEKYPNHKFVDCSVSGACPSFVTAYPTTKWTDGRTEVGFS